MARKNQELISIIMPAYNADKTLAMAVESVLSQTHPHWELIIIDDASCDRTWEIANIFAQQDHRIRPLRNEKNCGVSGTRVRGLEAARGQWIALLDSDDAWKPDKLEKQVALAEQTGAQLVFTGSAFMRVDGSAIDWILHVPKTTSYRKLLKQNLISNSSVLIRKDCYECHQVIGDDLHEDFVCWLRFLRAGGIACGIDEPLLIYRVSSNSKSGNKLRSAVMTWRSYRAVGLNFIASAYYMVWYTVSGILKHRHFK